LVTFTISGAGNRHDMDVTDISVYVFHAANLFLIFKPLDKDTIHFTNILHVKYLVRFDPEAFHTFPQSRQENAEIYFKLCHNFLPSHHSLMILQFQVDTIGF
jgi:hypothetical protein